MSKILSHPANRSEDKEAIKDMIPKNMVQGSVMLKKY